VAQARSGESVHDSSWGLEAVFVMVAVAAFTWGVFWAMGEGEAGAWLALMVSAFFACIALVTPRRVRLTPALLVVERPVGRRMIPLARIASVEWHEERAPRSGIPVAYVIVELADGEQLVLKGFPERCDPLYSDLHERWRAANAPR